MRQRHPRLRGLPRQVRVLVCLCALFVCVWCVLLLCTLEAYGRRARCSLSCVRRFCVVSARLKECGVNLRRANATGAEVCDCSGDVQRPGLLLLLRLFLKQKPMQPLPCSHTNAIRYRESATCWQVVQVSRTGCVHGRLYKDTPFLPSALAHPLRDFHPPLDLSQIPRCRSPFSFSTDETRGTRCFSSCTGVALQVFYYTNRLQRKGAFECDGHRHDVLSTCCSRSTLALFCE